MTEKYIFYVTFASGLEKPVKRLLYSNLKKILVLNILDGAIIFEYHTIEKVTKLKFLNNIFIVLSILENNSTNSLKQITKSLLKNVNKKFNFKFQQNTFKVLYLNENKLSIMPEEVRDIVSKFIIKNFYLYSEKSSQNFEEFLILKRSEGFYLFIYKITKKIKVKLFKGELRPEVAHTIISISNPNKNDIFLDPFAGYGGIAAQRAKLPFKQLHISDINPKLCNIINDRLKYIILNKSSDIKIQCSNFLVSKLPHNSFTKIVTDPPWGLFKTIPNIKEFYLKVLQKVFLALKKDGIIILVVSRDLNIYEILSYSNIPLEILEKFEILLSGKKASIYKLKKSTD